MGFFVPSLLRLRGRVGWGSAAREKPDRFARPHPNLPPQAEEGVEKTAPQDGNGLNLVPFNLCLPSSHSSYFWPARQLAG